MHKSVVTFQHNGRAGDVACGTAFEIKGANFEENLTSGKNMSGVNE